MSITRGGLAEGLELHRAGNHRRAEQVLRQVVTQDPGNADAVYLLGRACEALGDAAEALFNYRQAVWLRPEFAEAHQAIAALSSVGAAEPSPALGLNTRGIALAREGRLEEAAASLREALRISPEFVDARVNLGVVRTFQKRFDEARYCYEEALRARPTDPTLLANLSDLLREQEDYDGAAARARAALDLDPGHVGARINLGSALLMLRRTEDAEGCFRAALAAQPNNPDACSNLGEALRQQNRYHEAVDWCRRAIELRPGFPQAHNHLGLALTGLNQLEEAVTALREALRLSPGLLDAHANLAHALWRQGKFEDAVACCRETLAINPNFADAHNNLGVLAAKQGRLAEALEHYDRTIRLKPDSATAHFHRGLVRLVQGEFEEGFRDYEWRRKCTGLGVRPLPGPEWDGGPLDGGTVVLRPEQGLGDTLQFIRYAPLVRARGGAVVVAAAPALHPLLERCPGVGRLVPPDAPTDPDDLYVHMLSLPHLLGTRIDTVPGGVPYIFPPEDRLRHWKDRLVGTAGMKVGLVWQGNVYHPEDRFRSIPLATFGPLGDIPGVRLIGLQVGAGRDQLSAAAGGPDLLDLGGELDPTPGALADAAGLVRNLDLLITCDTSLAHLAGGMGVPVWVAVPFSPDWRWLLDREDSPWYPTMRLFRAPAPAEWAPVVARLAEALREAVAGRGATGS